MQQAHLPQWFHAIQEECRAQASQLSALEIERADLSDWDFFSEVGSMDPTQAQVSLPEDSPEGILVMDLFQALSEHPDLVKEHLFQALDPLANQETAQHVGQLTGGTLIYLPPHTHLTQPIELTLSANQGHHHILLVADQQSQAQYLERLQAKEDQGPGSLTLTVEVIAQAGAHINYLAMDTLGQEMQSLVQRQGLVQRDGHLDWALGVLNDGHQALSVDVQLVGDNSESTIRTVAISDHAQEQIVNSHIINHGSHSRGHIEQYGVILDQARLTYNAIGQIERWAKEADAQQESRILMLTESGRGDVNPILLIEEYEVTAGHAGSVGQVDEGQLYYLMSRGLPRRQAEHLVIRGFLGSVITRMPSQATRAEIVATIDRKLGYDQEGEGND